MLKQNSVNIYHNDDVLILWHWVTLPRENYDGWGACANVKSAVLDSQMNLAAIFWLVNIGNFLFTLSVKGKVLF